MPSSTSRTPSRLRLAARTVRRHVVGSYPWFFVRNLPRAMRPRTFSDHVRRKMLFDRRPYVTITADKALARDYVREKVGEHVLAKAYALADDPRTIDWGALPRTFVCKATHGTGGVIVVREDADPDARLPAEGAGRLLRTAVRPEHASPERMTEIALGWMGRRFGWGPGSTHEHQYRRIRPRVLVEELLRRADGTPPLEFNLYVFHGRCELIVAIADLMGSPTIDYFRPDWTRLTIRGKSPSSEVAPPAPANLDEMIRVAEALAAETDFVRVDLYDLGDRIAFGELTNTPRAGARHVDPTFEQLLGGYWARPR